jgi:hypothetical protein
VGKLGDHRDSTADARVSSATGGDAVQRGINYNTIVMLNADRVGQSSVPLEIHVRSQREMNLETRHSASVSSTLLVAHKPRRTSIHASAGHQLPMTACAANSFLESALFIWTYCLFSTIGQVTLHDRNAGGELQ